MVICQKASKVELKRARCAVLEAIKSSFPERGVTNRKASLFLSEAWQRNFEASKCAIPTLLPLSNNYPFKQSVAIITSFTSLLNLELLLVSVMAGLALLLT